MRRAITILQSCAQLKGNAALISLDDVYEVAGIVPERWLKELLEVCSTADYDKLERFIHDFILEAYPALQVNCRNNIFAP